MDEREFDMHGTPQLHITLDGVFFVAMVEKFGVGGWNSWLERTLADGRMLCWAADEPVPPIGVTVDLSDADLSGMPLDGVFLGDGVCMLAGARFDGASLRHATFRLCDLSRCNFDGAAVDGMTVDEAYCFEGSPPVGLPPALLRRCRAVPLESPPRSPGLMEIEVARVTLTAVEV